MDELHSVIWRSLTHPDETPDLGPLSEQEREAVRHWLDRDKERAENQRPALYFWSYDAPEPVKAGL